MNGFCFYARDVGAAPTLEGLESSVLLLYEPRKYFLVEVLAL